jgi:cephalosporin hydroxylase
MNVEQCYSALCNSPSDINEHLPTLKRYASECDHVIELGVRWVVSTFAFAVAKPKKFISIDIVDPRNLTQESLHWDSHQCGDRMNGIIDYCSLNNIDYQFILGDTTKIEIEETDLLFIDTLHTHNQITTELKLHGNKARKYLIFHDTVNYRFTNEPGEATGSPILEGDGIWTAIEKFIIENPQWKIHEIFTNCNGLTVLKRDNG